MRTVKIRGEDRKMNVWAVVTHGWERTMPIPIIFVVLDGLGDRPDPRHDNKTTLEAASTQNLDRLAKEGITGCVYTVGQGVAPESDAGVFSLLSYDPSTIDLSRGVVEVVGSGMEFKDGDLGLRCNYATVTDREIIDRRAGRNLTREDVEELTETINSDRRLRELAHFRLKSTTGHRAALLFYSDGARFSSSISNLDPGYDRKGGVAIAKSDLKLPAPIPRCTPLDSTDLAARTAELLNTFAHGIYSALKNHPVNNRRKEKGYLPANFLLMRDAGTRIPKVPTLKEKFGFRSIALVDLPVEVGIAKITGMDIERLHPNRSVSGYAERARKALELTKHYDFIYVHLKGPDEPGHDGDFDGKKKSIEEIDAGFFSEIKGREPYLLCVTADHSTPCTAKGHTDDPVPLLIAGPNIKPEGTQRFTEPYARKGTLGTLKHGKEILDILDKLRA